MENAQNPNIQAQSSAAIDPQIITDAGLDPKNPKHQQAAIEVIKNLQELQAPNREKERNALMREFGIQPDEYNKAVQSFMQRAEALNNQAISIEEQQTSLAARFKKNGLVQMALTVIGAVAAGYLALKKLKKGGAWNESGSGFKKYAGTGGFAVLGGGVVGWITSLFTTRPIRKNAEELQGQQEQLMAQHQQLVTETEQYSYNTFRNLAARMLQERVSKAAVEKPAAEEAVMPQKPDMKPEVKEAKSFTETVAEGAEKIGHKVEETGEKVKDAILGKKHADSKAEQVLAEKAEAEKVQHTVG